MLESTINTDRLAVRIRNDEVSIVIYTSEMHLDQSLT